MGKHVVVLAFKVNEIMLRIKHCQFSDLLKPVLKYSTIYIFTNSLCNVYLNKLCYYLSCAMYLVVSTYIFCNMMLKDAVTSNRYAGKSSNDPFYR